MLVAGFHTLPQLLLLTGFCLFSGWDLDATGVAAGVLGILVITTFSTALALIFSAVNVYYRDFQNIVSTITQFMHFLVPMMYPLSRVMKHAETFPVLFRSIWLIRWPRCRLVAAGCLVPVAKTTRRAAQREAWCSQTTCWCAA
jgi:hypothetical protein